MDGVGERSGIRKGRRRDAYPIRDTSMQFADVEGVRMEAAPGGRGVCPGCAAPVLAKCGEVNVWHWAHEVPCTVIGEAETAWHRRLKERFPPECREIVRENHRADVVWGGSVYEFQRKPLEPSEYQERTSFWRKQGYAVRWVFYHADHPETFVSTIRKGGEYVSFRWKWPKRRLECVQTPFYLDGGWEQLFQVKRIYWSDKVGGWGVFNDIAV